MKKLTSNQARKMYLDYFKIKGHLVMPSASLIPENDPSLLWINAGVAPLKKYFDGSKKPISNRLTNSQKCLRTNDIENVGKTARHHTFFEMLGNFSIGDYFKSEALEMAYELLTSKEYFDIDKEKLYMTVYSEDKEAYDKWVAIGIDKSHIIKMDSNFWDIGSGPCGPDSEIFFDRGEKYDPDNVGLDLIKKDLENDRYIEIWNNVFSQFNHTEGKNRSNFPELPSKNIDTGMGLERLVCILQGGQTNYDTDLFLPIINETEKIANVKYDGQMAFKVIADHVRTLVFALSDGAMFSNESRGYVLRRLLRRGSRYGREIGIFKPFMYKLVDKVVEIMESYYPYLKSNKLAVIKEIKKEEETFLKTLESGEKRLNEMILSGSKISGKDVFKLYDTYGFPFELTKEILEEKGIIINKEDFDKCMQLQKQIAREANKTTSGMNIQSDIVNFKEVSVFAGYDELETKSKVIYVSDLDGMKKEIYTEGIIILDKTPFYATSGGQVNDTGFITANGLKVEVYDTVKTINHQNACYVRIIEGSIKTGDEVTCVVDKQRRFATSQNHSATHLLQKSLQEVLDDSVHQCGSFVNSQVLRFDFRYSGDINEDDIIKVESLVNEKIQQKNNASICNMDIKDAKKLGAMALFGEKYKDVVRVVTFGNSVEFCGGTHVKNTGDIKRFAIKSIESKGLNVYRIEAACDLNVESEMFEMIKPYNDEMIIILEKAKKIIEDAQNQGISLTFNANISNDKPVCYKDIISNKLEVINLRKAFVTLEKVYKEQLVNLELKKVKDIINTKMDGRYGEVVIMKTFNKDINILKTMAAEICDKLSNGIVFMANVSDNKAVNYIARSSSNLKGKISMGALIKDVSLLSDGNGGGNDVFAQGGGNNIEKLDFIIEFVKSKIIEKE